MEYVFLFFFGWMVVCLPAIIFTAVANSRRRRETAELNDRITALSRQLAYLEQRSREGVPSPQAAAPPPVAPAMKITAEEARGGVPPQAAQPPKSAYEPVSYPTPPPPPPIVAPPVAAQSQQPVQPKPVEPLTPKVYPPVQPAPVSKPAPPLMAAPEKVAPVTPGMNLPPKPPMPQQPASAQVRSGAGYSNLNLGAASPPLPEKKRSASLEETLGTNWLPKLGIAIVVIGVGFLVAAKWLDLPPALRVLILYAGAAGALFGGIFAERSERYRTLGRALIGGGWAITVLVTYGLRHAPFLAVLPSNALDLLLLLAVIAVMVWHTLKYKSQLVTGAGFLLGFAAITLNPDPPYNLIAGALLVAGMTIIVMRYRWWELEVFGILASYLNHFYWLYTIFGFNFGSPRPRFPHHTVSALLVIAYWAMFRCSYVWRKITSHEEEAVSTIAGLLNPLLFLAVMKYQSFHPEWAFYALLILGAVEFLLGQLPVSRRRVAPFRVLSSLGAAFMIAAIPFKYSGDSLEILWLVGAEAFLLAGVFVRERLFRGFGLIISTLIVFYTLLFRVEPLLQELLNGQAHYHPQYAIVLAGIAAVLYFNSHVVRRRWPELFEEELESQGLKALSFAASILAVNAVYAYLDDKAIGIVLALFVAALTLLGKQFSINELVYQAHWITAVAFVQTVISGAPLETKWHSVPERILVFAPVAGLLYLASRYVRLSETNLKAVFSGGYSWAATSLLAVLIGFQAREPWLGLSWMVLATCLAIVARFWKDRALLWQTHLLSLLAAGWTLYASFAPEYRKGWVQLASVGITAALLYLLNWITNVEEIIGDEHISQVYSWAASLLTSWLIWYRLDANNVSLAWGVFGLLLFELGNWRSWGFLRIQAYVALAFSFAHIFYANFNTLSAPGIFSPPIITVILLVPIYFWVYWQLHGRKSASAVEGKIRIEYLIASLGTATLAALARFELPLDVVVIGYAAIVLGTLLIAWLTRLQIFLYQALVMLGVTAFRISMHNFYHLHESFSANLSCSAWAIGLMAVGVPVCLQIRRQNQENTATAGWTGALARHPDQPMFFVPFALLSVLLWLKVASGMITLAWGAEAVMVFVLALWAKVRSFRLAGLGLLLLCAAKIVFWDVWQVSDLTARYLTLIGVGALILVVSYLISRNREALREYL
jgi:hypothetical protein